MNNYYLLSWKDESTTVSAFYQHNTKLDHELIKDLEGINSLPFDFELKKVTETPGGISIENDLVGVKEIWPDYLPNNMAWPLMSEQLQNLINNNLTGNEDIDWISCNVKNENKVTTYFILRFNSKKDVLDMEKTLFVENTDQIIRPCFSSTKIKKYSIFAKPSAHNLWKITPGIYINEDIRKKIIKEKLSGMGFEKARIS